MTDCSVVIIAKNAGATIKECVANALQITKDVVVVTDNNLNDPTAQIAQEAGARIIMQPWISYSANKNIGNYYAVNNWIFWLDADEIITTELANEVKHCLMHANENYCYAVNRLNFFGNKAIRFGAWNNDWQVRLFNKKKISWNEQQLVHETLQIPDNITTIKLQNRLKHYTTPNYTAYVQKLKKYAAEYKLQHAKNQPVKLVFSPIARFISEYFIKLGFLDGVEGIKIAAAHAYYVYLKYR
jgi:glycosyltransferase involved in cell wall biosynthesis